MPLSEILTCKVWVIWLTSALPTCYNHWLSFPYSSSITGIRCKICTINSFIFQRNAWLQKGDSSVGQKLKERRTLLDCYFKLVFSTPLSSSHYRNWTGSVIICKIKESFIFLQKGMGFEPMFVDSQANTQPLHHLYNNFAGSIISVGL